MSYTPSQAVTIEFCTQNPATGAAQNGDSLPTGTFSRNGTDDGTVTVTVTNVDTGRYKAAFTIPSGAAAKDVCDLSVAATVNSVAGKGIVWRGLIDTKIVSQLNDSPYNGGAVASVTGNVGGNVVGNVNGNVAGSVGSVTAAVTVGTNNDKTGYSLNLAQALNEATVSATLGGALNAARAQGFGKWTIVGDTLNLYASDNSTIIKSFTLTPSGGPYTART